MNDSLKQALLRKQTGNPQPVKPKGTIPDPIQYAGPGSHTAPDGKTYTITYEESQDGN